jgi:hypothetical protein
MHQLLLSLTLSGRLDTPLPSCMCKEMPIIPGNRVVDKKRIIGKNGGPRMRRGTRGPRGGVPGEGTALLQQLTLLTLWVWWQSIRGMSWSLGSERTETQTHEDCPTADRTNRKKKLFDVFRSRGADSMRTCK